MGNHEPGVVSLESCDDNEQQSGGATLIDHQPIDMESAAWRFAKLGMGIAGAVAVLSVLSGSIVFALLAITIALAPIIFLLKVFKDNTGRVHNATPLRVITSLILGGVYSLPLMPVLLPAFAINYIGDMILDRGVVAADSLLASVDTKWEESRHEAPFPWYSPWRWLGYNKVENVMRSIEVPRYTGFARIALKALRDFLVVLQLYWYAFLIYFVLRTFGYVASRVMSRVGMKLELAFPA